MRIHPLSRGCRSCGVLLAVLAIVVSHPAATLHAVPEFTREVQPAGQARPLLANGKHEQSGASLPAAAGEVVVAWQPESRLPVQRPTGRFDADRASSEWGQAAEALKERTGLEVLDVQPEYGMGLVAVTPGREQAESARLSALPWVRYAEPNFLARATDYPDDPYIGYQWHMRRIGAAAAWDLTFGSYSLVVAVIDSGIDLDHPEFAGRVAQGYDYVRGDWNPDDENGHGTHVSGIINAAASNGIGVAGLAAQVRVLPLKVLDAQGSGDYYHIGLAIRRAADNAAAVINLSLGGLSDSQDWRDAVAYAASRNVLMVAAAGNCAQGGPPCGGMNNPDYYPAALPQVLAVGATDHYDNWASYSGFKPYVGLVAPGGQAPDPIWSTIPGGYGLEYGTSMATPLVSAAAALVLTFMPAATVAEVTEILRNTADKVGPYAYIGGRNDYYGAGRLNVGRAVRWAYPPSLNPIAQSPAFLLGDGRQQAHVTLPLTSESDRPLTWEATVVHGASWLQTQPGSGVISSRSAGQLRLQADASRLTPGVYDGVVEVRAVAPLAGAPQVVFVRLRVVPSIHRQWLPSISHQHDPTQWVDPAAGGAPIYPTDDTPSRVALPFPVSFYGNTHSAVSISFKGFVSFTQPGSGGSATQSACLPTAAQPNDAVYVLWQNWLSSLGGQVYVHTPDIDRFVVTWAGVRRYAGDLPHSFQLVFFRNGRLLLQYQSVQSPVMGVVGIEGWDGTFAQQIACEGAGQPPASGDAFTLEATLPW